MIALAIGCASWSAIGSDTFKPRAREVDYSGFSDRISLCGNPDSHFEDKILIIQDNLRL